MTQVLLTALTEIARLRTDLRGDFSMGSHQSDIARKALAEWSAGQTASFDAWIGVLDEEVIQGEYGYEPGEFSVYREAWRWAFDQGLTPSEAFARACEAHKEDRSSRAAITPTPDTTTAEVAAMPVTRSGMPSNLDRNPS